MDKPLNPIPFNPELMSIRQAEDCAMTLSDIFSAIDRGVDPEQIVHSLTQARKIMLSKYGAAK